MDTSFWVFCWRRLICMGKMREPSHYWHIDDRIVDSGYCLDRWLPGAP